MDEAERQKTFQELWDTYREQIYRYVVFALGQREDAKDVVQEIFWKVWCFLPKFRGEAKPSTWLYRIAMNTLTNHHRRHRIRQFFSLETIPEDSLSTPSGNSPVEKMLQHLPRMLSNLSPKLSQVIVLYYYERFSILEIVNLLEIPEPTVKARLQRARIKLYKLLEPWGK